MIVEVNKLIKSQVSKNFIISVIKQAGKKLKCDFILSVALVDNKTIKKLNHQYLKINQTTDVLSFSEPAEIIISWPMVITQAKKQKHSQKKELTFLLIHGLLHILGYDHKTKRQQDIMEKKFKQVISFLK